MLDIVSREMWRAAPPVGTVPMEAAAVHVMCNVTITDVCHDLRDCIDKVQRWQFTAFNIMKEKDTRYNFMIGADGRAYEVRGWGVAPKLPKWWRAWSPHSVYIAFMAPCGDQVTAAMEETRKALVAYGLAQGHIAESHDWVDIHKRTLSSLGLYHHAGPQILPKPGEPFRPEDALIRVK